MQYFPVLFMSNIDEGGGFIASLPFYTIFYHSQPKTEPKYYATAPV